MNDKLTLQELIDLLAARHQMEQHDADAFVKAFWALVEEGLKRDNYVKIKGLGTFKLIDTEARESIDIHTGERIEIQSHARITFTPDATLRDQINRPFAHFETVILNEGIQFDNLDEKPEDDDEDKEVNESVESDIPSQEQEMLESSQSERQPVDSIKECVAEELGNSSKEQETTESSQSEKLLKKTVENQKMLDIPEEQPVEKKLGPDIESSDFIIPEEEMPLVEEPTSSVVSLQKENDSDAEPADMAVSVHEVKQSHAEPGVDNQSLDNNEQPLGEGISATENQLEESVASEVSHTANIEDIAAVKTESESIVAAAAAEEEEEEERLDDSEKKEESIEVKKEGTVVQPKEETKSAEEEKQLESSFENESLFAEVLSTKKPRFPWCMVATILFMGILIGGIVAWGILSGRRYIPESMVKRFVSVEKQLAEQQKEMTDSIIATALPMVKDSLEVKPDSVLDSSDSMTTVEQVELPNGGEIKEKIPSEIQIVTAEPLKEKKQEKEVEKKEEFKVLSDKISYKITGTLSTHTIRRGDSLVKLALKFYGNKKLWPYIVKHNRKVIKNPDNVPIGTTIRIPQLSPKTNL